MITALTQDAIVSARSPEDPQQCSVRGLFKAPPLVVLHVPMWPTHYALLLKPSRTHRERIRTAMA